MKKRIISVIIAFVLILGMQVLGFAGPVDPPGSTPTIPPEYTSAIICLIPPDEIPYEELP